MSAQQRGDMVEALLPEAAGLVVDVHEGSAEDIKTRLAGLSRHELEAVTVVLAALVDPDRPLRQALAWVDFDEYGEPLKPVASRSEKAIRDHVPRLARVRGGVDVVLVHRALAPGRHGDMRLSQDERRLAVQVGRRRGMTFDEIAERLGMTAKAVERSWERSKARERAAAAVAGRQSSVRPVEGAAVA
ncbi:hypothetical protein F3K34_43860 [Streptomyces sp. LBUM 1486]|uniref:hypothetical protein n=2 Tax=Streptomyces scabiei TaxID=1930 RepID=UPI001B31B95B|nr:MULTISPECIES: hypothetical protein [Streptomyces]MBP5918724.1 hypothetical protein [Streptomyces sp. LBUM 1486]MDX2800148.1 hypothetical protein [Streptomyces scabiei]MDX3127072.1 hypothetical protein [Streptomyces scabiei]